MAIDFPNSPTNGQEFVSGATTWVYDGSKWKLKTATTASNDSMPVGSIMWFAGSSAPNGWIACNGASYSTGTYPNLYAVIGYTYGGSGSSFNVPDITALDGSYYIRYTTAVGVTSTTSLATAPVGCMMDWPTTSSYPTGWLRCDGSAVSRTSYADLFALIGTTYGTGDNSTTFNLPNMIDAFSGTPVTIIKASLGGTVEPSTVAHAASHTEGGSDVITVTGNQIANYQSYRNVIINGSMSVAQRVTSLASINTGGYKTADRWTMNYTSLGTWTQSVENDAPTGSGLRKSLKMLCTTADSSPATADFLGIVELVEGQNLQHFAKGTSSAKKFAMSFWVKSNVTGTYAVYLLDNDNSRHTSKQYSISASGTWEKKTLIFDADTTGAFDNDNAASLQVVFGLGAGTTYTSGAVQTWGSIVNGNILPGQVNVAAATNNYWQVTGVQLEAGDVATPFEFEPYETTLRKCKRYCQVIKPGTAYGEFAYGFQYSSTTGYYYLSLPVDFRAYPNVFTPTGNFQLEEYNSDQITLTTGNITLYPQGTTSSITIQATGTTFNAGIGGRIRANNDTTANWIISAEL